MRFLFALLIIAPMHLVSQDFKVMSYNIRYANTGDGDNQWEYRKQDVTDLIQEYAPLVLGVQEATHEQMSYMDTQLKVYSFVGVGRDDGKTKGEYSAIFYNTDVLEVLESGTFWLSETPEKVSKAWDAALPRICTWAKFKIKNSDFTFYHFNTHFDHRGTIARLESAKLIAQKVTKLNNENLPVVITGDFNATPDKEPIIHLRKHFDDAAKISDSRPSGPQGTFSGFDVNAPLGDRIDYIFTKGFKVLTHQNVDDKRENGLWVSDHLPVLVQVKF